MKTKTLLLSCLLSLMGTSTSAQAKISEGEAIEKAKEYGRSLPTNIVDLVETSIEEELANISFINAFGYNFIMHDKSGDCGFLIVIDFEGNVNEEETFSTWNCY